MDLIEAYIYEVTRRLSEKMREDVGMELRSSIMDILPDDYTEEDVKEALSKLGNPANLAASYRDKPMYLIGPNMYDIYIQTFKLALPWVILITASVHIIASIFSYSGEEVILMTVIKELGLIIANIVNVLIYTFFWFTITFAVIDRVAGHKHNKPKDSWSPSDLKHVVIIPKKKTITIGEVILSIIWTLIWVIAFFYADHLVGIYQTIDGKLQMVIPLFNQEVLMNFSMLIIVLAILEILLALYKWKIGKWTMPLAHVNTILHVLSAVIFIVIISQSNLLNEAVIPYMADILEKPTANIVSYLDWFWRMIIACVVIPLLFEIYDTYRKARI